MLRAALAALATLPLLAGAVSAASPSPTVGGELAAVGNAITVTSHGNVPARVVMAAEAVTLSETTFSLAPGEAHRLTFTGPAAGHVYATLAVAETAGDTANVTLAVNLRPIPSPGDGLPIVALLVLACLALAARRVQPWRWRLVKT
jgi:hypothetical protein